MTTNYQVQGSDFSDLFIPRDLFSSGGLWAWGDNAYGQLGDNTAVAKSSPVQTIAAGTNWKQSSGGKRTTAAIKTDGTLWLWGNNGYGQLGDNTTAAKSSPVQTIAAGTNWKLVAGGGYGHTAAIKTDGTLWLWGANNGGQLGDNTTANKSSPVQTIAAGTNWKQVACASTYTVAIKTDGTLWLWGANGYGQLGDNTTAAKSSPVQTIAAGTNWKLVAGGGSAGSAANSAGTTTAIKTDGTLWTWGGNNNGQLGDNTTAAKSSPVQTIAGGTNWKQVSFKMSAWNYTYSHTAAIKTDGTLWSWGNNNLGQLGDNTTIGKSSPVQTISGGTNWKQVSAFASGDFQGHTAAIKTDGTLWLWGANGSGQLGDNTTAAKSSPVQTIVGGTNWKQVDVGSYGYTIAITDIY